MEKEKTVYPPVDFSEFPPTTYEQWKEEAITSLKGGDFDKKLMSQTFEGITLKPIYTKADVEETNAFPGQPGYLRGVCAGGYMTDPWETAQEILADSPKAVNEAIKKERAGSVDALHVKLSPAAKGCAAEQASGADIFNVEDVKTAFDGVDFKDVGLHIPCFESSLPMLSLLSAAKGCFKNAHGAVCASPLSSLAGSGALSRPMSQLYDEMAEAVRFAKGETKGVRAILCSGKVYANGGADSVTELACMLAEVSEYLDAMQERKVDISDAAKSMRLELTLGSNFFMEIAKLRAARVLFSHVVESFGGDEEAQKADLFAVTAPFNKTVYDPYVNILRTTTEAFSGVLGGACTLSVAPFDEPAGKSDEQAKRVARNISTMLKEEFDLLAPVDPSGGSYYIETLTNEVIQKAFARFMEIEGEGGLLKALLAGSVQADVEKTLLDKQQKLNTRALRAVGTNMYANLLEEPLTRESKWRKAKAPKASPLTLKAEGQALKKAFTEGADLPSVYAALKSAPGETCKAIESHRLTEQFEALRQQTKAGGGIKVFSCNMGPIPQHKARADFSRGFFEVGGFEVIGNDGFTDVSVAVSAAVQSKAQVCVICSTDDTYPELVPAIAKGVKEKAPGMMVVLAGAPAPEHKDSYVAAGVDDFIHVRANCYAILSKIQKAGGKN